jgi:hypothetical protein
MLSEGTVPLGAGCDKTGLVTVEIGLAARVDAGFGAGSFWGAGSGEGTGAVVDGAGSGAGTVVVSEREPARDTPVPSDTPAQATPSVAAAATASFGALEHNRNP